MIVLVFQWRIERMGELKEVIRKSGAVVQSTVLVCLEFIRRGSTLFSLKRRRLIILWIDDMKVLLRALATFWLINQVSCGRISR